MNESSAEQPRVREVALWVFAAAVLPLSPIAIYLRPLTGNVFSLLCILVILVWYKARRFTPGVYFVVLITLLLSTLTSLYWNSLKLIALPVYFLSAVVLVSRLDDADRTYFTTLASKALVVILIGCIVGFVYVLFGGQALIEFANQDGRMNGLYLTTLSNSKVLNVIRPAGIFDEPGTLSFVVCMIAALRHSLGMRKRTTWAMLGMGFITFSVAHLAYVLLHLMAEVKTSFARTLKYAVVMLGALTLAIAYVPVIHSVVSDTLFQRFVFDGGGFAGDNRTVLLLSALSQLDMRVFWWGLDVDCIVNASACFAKGYPQFGENPLAPLVLYGVFNSWPYYALEGGLVALFVMRRSFIALGMFLLLLQRPSVMSFGYAILIVLAFRTILDRSIQTRLNYT